ncbi:hypothetical protein BGZ96_011823 [Linnemannia gamsii]|uniref:Tail specific protease domain-containing protein n=1 Tax=Linnemannia gamsii TaxID=64522 RepID=A0ABQ7JRJ1_9FUNG|nr:hypothetical protein BGZ96_011823 [Linnemannia gamsii]
MIFLRSHFFSAFVAVLANFSYAAPTSSISASIEPNSTTSTDACSILAQVKLKDMKYKHVVDCYNAIPFDSAKADTTLDTMITIFRDYYVFTDAALSSTATPPFANAPHDILGELEKIQIRLKTYTSDYQFHKDINAASVRVYASYANKRHKDCIVETINGEDALTHLRAYARDVEGMSHDPNVRLNFILASKTYNVTKKKFTIAAGKFASRNTIPETPYIDYQLKCHNRTDPIHFRDEWRVFPQIRAAFTDAISYVQNHCLVPPKTDDDGDDVPSPTSSIAPIHSRFNHVLQIQKRAENEPTAPTPHPPTNTNCFSGKALVIGNGTVFFHLKDRPDTGVLVCNTLHVSDVGLEKATILQGLAAFHKCNVTNIILDFQHNPGGDLDLSAFLVQTLFPNKNPLDAAFTSDMRVSKSLQDLARLSYGNPDSYFNAHDFINFSKNNTNYENNDLFAKPVDSIRNGRHNLWTEKTALVYTPLTTEERSTIAKFPWTAKAENIRLLSDGRCMSACGMAGYFFTTEHKVESYAIGGTSGEDLALFAFAGASVMKLSELQGFYKTVGINSSMTDLPYKGNLTFSWLELYGKDRNIPLEYDAELYRPKHRLDFTPKNARYREVLWKEVADASWK